MRRTEFLFVFLAGVSLAACPRARAEDAAPAEPPTAPLNEPDRTAVHPESGGQPEHSGHAGHGEHANHAGSAESAEHSGHAEHAGHDAHAGHGAHSSRPSDCTESQTWSPDTAMCAKLPGTGEPGAPERTELMVHGNLFLTGITEEGPRGRRAFAAPDMLMAEASRDLSPTHRIGLSLMLTAEKWLFPDRGYPLLMQVGEKDPAGVPFVDAQHPHSSPIMGLELSDTILLGGDRAHPLKLSFAPRGASTDGPIAFMHRPTGAVNPDAPLGHHVGQDVGHISSTVLGASLGAGSNYFEVSAFNGTEPEPESVDLPLGAPSSFAARWTHELSPSLMAMASAAYVKDPEPLDPSVTHYLRYSASLYLRDHLPNGWNADDTMIFGWIRNLDHAPNLFSVSQEFAIRSAENAVWGRLEVLQRTPAELLLATVSDPDDGRWVGAFTLGYTRALARCEGLTLGAGLSGTKSFLPREFTGAYGGNPWSGKVFLQLSGMGTTSF